MNNVVNNIKAGEKHDAFEGVSGFKLARAIADERENKTGNRHAVQRVLDYVDQFNGRDREHYSFDVVEIIKETVLPS
jgi:hypothetical protein